MTEVRNDEQKLKKLATSEQVENMHTRLVREILSAQSQIKGTDEIIGSTLARIGHENEAYWRSITEDLHFLKKPLEHKWYIDATRKVFNCMFVFLLFLILLNIYHNLNEITQKLTALGV
jgi:hypothetical protein